ncbi:MAG: hypothetical protein ACRCY8_13895 [Dermatophilaceae bacterium]
MWSVGSAWSTRRCGRAATACFEGNKAGLGFIVGFRTVRITGHDHLATDPITQLAQNILDSLNLSPE